jgi:hypothetical protein
MEIRVTCVKTFFVVVSLMGLVCRSSAEEFGDFTYTDLGTSIRITDFREDVAGPVVVPEEINGKPVTSVWREAFKDCAQITSLSIPASVTSIGDRICSGCYALETVNLPAQLDEIPCGAFSYCYRLKNIQIPSSVTFIGEGAFAECFQLESVDLPSALHTLDIEAFMNCRAIKSITIPSSLDSLSCGVFFGCENLKKVNFAEFSTLVEIRDSAFYGCTNLSQIDLPPTVETIGGEAFYGCESLTQIVIPSSVTGLEGAAFDACWGLAAITVEEENEFYASEVGVLMNKKKRVIIRCPAGFIGNFVIPSTVISINRDSFKDCSGLTSVTIPPSVTRIYERAFENCIGLETLDIPSSVSRIDSRSFFGCNSLTAITLPVGLDSISESLLANCTALTEVEIPATASVLNPDAFRNCVSLETIVIPSSVTNINNAFQGCKGLVDVSFSLPSSVIYITTDAFKDCKSLEEFVIPASVSSVYYNAFIGCESLSSISLSASVTGFTVSAVDGCKAFTTYEVDPANSNFTSIDGILLNKDQTIALDCPEGFVGTFSVPASVFVISDSAFANCEGLTEITFEESSNLATIGYRGFYGCVSLSTASIPTTVSTIKRSAFSQCTSITSIHIPASVTKIETDAFGGLTNLVTYEVAPENTLVSSIDGILYNKDQSILLSCPAMFTGSFTVPSTVTTIGSFSGCAGLTAISIPSTVTAIGGAAFSDCTGLASVNIPSSVTYFGDSVFSGCTNLSSVILSSSIPKIGPGTFLGCALLSEVFVPASVTDISNSAFDGCDALTVIHVDSENPVFSSQGGVIFNKAGTSLKRCPPGYTGVLAVPPSVTEISPGSFSDCGKITEVTIPALVSDVSGDAFSGCRSLLAINADPANPNYFSDAGVLFWVGLDPVTNDEIIFLSHFPGGVGGVYQLPDYVDDVWSTAFDDSAYLTAIDVSSTNRKLSSVEGVLFDKDLRLLIRCPGGFEGSFSLPPSASGIRANGFKNCINLTRVVITSRNFGQGGNVFDGCDSLESIVIFGFEPRPRFNTEVVIYFLGDESSVFNSGSLAIYERVRLGLSTFFKRWLLTEGFDYDTPIDQGSQVGGVSLLTAYALNLQSGENLPTPVVEGDQLVLNFSAGKPGITYEVESSTNLVDWNSTNVSVSHLNEDCLLSASVELEGQSKFLRIVIRN